MISELEPIFVEYVPDELTDGVLYVSIRFRTAVHRCCCGCGNEIATPLHPDRWQLLFDGLAVSLFPSIGNWGHPCKSHYFVRSNRVEWAQRFTPQQISAVRERDRREREVRISADETERSAAAIEVPPRRVIRARSWIGARLNRTIRRAQGRLRR